MNGFLVVNEFFCSLCFSNFSRVVFVLLSTSLVREPNRNPDTNENQPRHRRCAVINDLIVALCEYSSSTFEVNRNRNKCLEWRRVMHGKKRQFVGPQIRRCCAHFVLMASSCRTFVLYFYETVWASSV